jgi:hypothetical protein
MDAKKTTRTPLSVAVCAVWILSFGATAAFAGEVTGNGKQLTVNGMSNCAYSGQEDLQFWEPTADPTDPAGQGDPDDPVDNFVRGVPGHAQSWGQIPKVVRDAISLEGFHPGQACNPTFDGGEP